jgi:hypothetical protein
VGKSEGKRTLGTTRRPRKNNIKTDRVGWYGLDKSGSGYGRVEGSCEHGNELYGSINMLGNSRAADRLSQGGLGSMDLATSMSSAI